MHSNLLTFSPFDGIGIMFEQKLINNRFDFLALTSPSTQSPGLSHCLFSEMPHEHFAAQSSSGFRVSCDTVEKWDERMVHRLPQYHSVVVVRGEKQQRTSFSRRRGMMQRSCLFCSTSNTKENIFFVLCQQSIT